MKKSMKARYLETRTITDRLGFNEVTTIIQRIVDRLLKEDEQRPEGLRERYTRSLCRATANHLNRIDDSGILGRLKAVRDESVYAKEDSADLFVAAACVGHTSLLKRLLKEGAKTDARSAYFGGALREAAFGGHKDTVLLLLEHGVNSNAQKVELPLVPLLYLFEDSHQTALQAAAFAGHEHIVRLLLKPKYRVDTSGEYEKAILDAAQGGHSCLMQFLRGLVFSKKKEPPCLKECILHKACQYGHVQMVQTMLEAGTGVESLALRNHSPLALAASRGFDEIVKILLAKGASPDGPVLLVETTTPLCEAVKGGYERVAQTLLRHGADINAGYPSPLFIAAKYGHDHVVRLLLESGALLDQELISCDTIIGIAASGGCESVMRLLVEYGANVTTGKNILQCCVT